MPLLVGVGDGLADQVVLTLEFADLWGHLALALRQAVSESLGDGLLHTGEVVLEGVIDKVDVAVGGTDHFLVVHLLDFGTLFLDFLDFLLLQSPPVPHDGA
jgi:hypothetical protein